MMLMIKSRDSINRPRQTAHIINSESSLYRENSREYIYRLHHLSIDELEAFTTHHHSNSKSTLLKFTEGYL